MNNKRKHKKYLQILIIPDDKSEPTRFGIPVNRLKYLKMLAVFLVIHIVLGFVTYFLFYKTFKKNRELYTENQRLQENNRRIYELDEASEELETSLKKIKLALGLGTVDNSEMATGMIDQTFQNPPIMPVDDSKILVPQRSDSITNWKYYNVHRSKSQLHSFDRNMPTYLPVEGTVTKDYEVPLYTGDPQHRGIDIASTRGALIRAAADGIVVFSGWTYDFGNVVIIYHGAGYRTYYGHNQRILVQRNSFVKKGDPIALMGNSGISSGFHLHFEIWRDGTPLDPKKYILAFADMSKTK